MGQQLEAAEKHWKDDLHNLYMKELDRTNTHTTDVHAQMDLRPECVQQDVLEVMYYGFERWRNTIMSGGEAFLALVPGLIKQAL